MANKNILAVDTSSKTLSVALHSKAGNVFEINLDGSPSHSEQLIESIQKGLKKLKLKKSDLDAFVWGLGPGSFTGLRIGFSVLKGLHLGLGKRAFGASSLDLIALGSSINEGKLIVCVDARRERIYTAVYQFKDGVPTKTFEDSVITFEQLVRKAGSGAVFAGDALIAYGERLRKTCGKKALLLGSHFWYPRALFLIKLFSCLPAGGESKGKWLKPLTLRTMIPQYLRKSTAEERSGRKLR